MSQSYHSETEHACTLMTLMTFRSGEPTVSTPRSGNPTVSTPRRVRTFSSFERENTLTRTRASINIQAVATLHVVQLIITSIISSTGIKKKRNLDFQSCHEAGQICLFIGAEVFKR